MGHQQKLFDEKFTVKIMTSESPQIDLLNMIIQSQIIVEKSQTITFNTLFIRQKNFIKIAHHSKCRASYALILMHLPLSSTCNSLIPLCQYA